jgi:hypothetical protein
VTVVAVGMVKDEADVLVATVHHLFTQVDAVVVADNLSMDGTSDLLRGLAEVWPDQLLVLDDDEPGYYQSQKVTHLANVARREFGADWVVPFDADEWWYSPFGTVKEVLEPIAPQWLVVPVPIYNHVVTGADESAVANPFHRLGWREVAPLPLHKVACRWREDLVIEMGNHGARYDGGATIYTERPLVIRHFPYRSLEQFTRKVRNGAAAYAAAGERLPESYGAHWRQWGELSDDELRGVFETWYSRADPRATSTPEDAEGKACVLEPLIFDPVTNL